MAHDFRPKASQQGANAIINTSDSRGRQEAITPIDTLGTVGGMGGRIGRLVLVIED